MSYALAQRGVLRGLGQAPADPRDVSGIVPPECALLANYQRPPTTIQPNQILVVAFPKTTYSAGDPMPGVLAKILGAKGEGGQALWDLLSTGRAYNFVSGGWMRDTKSDQSYTKGTVWLAFQPRAARSANALRNDAKLLLEKALQFSGLPVSRTNPSGSTVDMNLQLAAVAGGRSDDQLREAAYRAAGGIGQFGSFVRYIFSYARVGAAGATISDKFKEVAANVNGAVELVRGAKQVADAARAQATQSLEMDPAAAMQVLQNAEDILKRALSGIKVGVALAPKVPEFADRARSDISLEIRRRILDAAESRIRSTSPLELAREYYRCSILREAAKQVASQLDAVVAALEGARGAALWLSNNSEAIAAAEAQLTDALGRVRYAMEQVPLGFWLRNRFGVPTWGWAAMGVAVFLGGAVYLRKKRRKKKPTKNRRRRRRRRAA